ncbi:MAG: hydrogenase nickel incorporation protein HypB [Spirochaetes bacterium]|nr:hydrogenase nickel incorporation protein HypB [Spirochaetota bacterium]HOJ27837.1 hydrogenase nickel incorporation protein HypB [Spirochaetota bacterium]HOM09143.1 hydrogenase nickel incorporation protein HypB [Spirochaetota bacterium]HPP49008.1 hydrogenase nickel incorporation protein HypB [Spirochaetota bacterium]HXK64925.1 hydrogenase nickel incorporation protein HypB [Spirochaetota bacterium]
MEIQVLQNIYESNIQKAEEIKKLLSQKKVYMFDIMSSPGAGKTTITDRIINDLIKDYNIALIEGDIETTNDAQRLAKYNIPIVQIETKLFGGACHLESSWILGCLEKFDLNAVDVVIIENVGNLVCPAEFELGDDERVVVLSVTEGEDKPVKYPLMFNSSHTLLINKIDLLPYLDFNMDELLANVKRTNPKMEVHKVSAKTGEGIEGFLKALRSRIKNKVGR